MSRSKASKSNKAEDGWRAVRREDLEAWAGRKAVERGAKYREEGRVENLAVAGDGGLLATVVGDERYAALVRLGADRRPESQCACPVGHACKHAVATILEYLRALDENREVPVARADDPRWHELDEPYPEGREDEALSARLRGMSRTELIDAIRALLDAVPGAREAIRDIIGPGR